MEILEFVFQSFWHWLGTFVILGTIFSGIGNLFSIRKYVQKQEDPKEPTNED